MTKREQTIKQAAQEYAQEIERRFPGARTDAVIESFEGFDAWIEVELPPDLHDRHEDVMDLTADLNARYDEKGVHLIATVAYAEEEVESHG